MKSITYDDDRPVSYFAARQVSFLINHPSSVETGDVYAALHEWLVGQSSPVKLQQSRAVRYQGKGEESTTIFYGELESTRDYARDVEQTFAVIDALNERRGEALIAGGRVRQIAPNWLMAGAQSHATVGGPGIEPVPVDDDPDTVPLTAGHRPYEFWFPTDSAINVQNPVMSAWANRQNAAPVDVYVLDTAPCREQLAEADSRWKTHSLLSTRNDWLKIHYYEDFAGSSNQLALLTAHETGYSLHGYPDTDYSDHGLFVAGIIHSIAPNARIHLIEVLNKYTVGTAEILNQGVNYALTLSERGVPLVNASLMLAAPHQGVHPNVNPAERHFIEAHQHNGLLDEELTLSVKEAFDLIQLRSGTTIAAAGNDGDPNNHPAARYPALYTSVTGISALNRTGGFASYSNLADNPILRGLATFGGDVNDGLMGVYTGVFPNGAPNNTGWARWAGTSFASPVICGLVAMMCGQGFSPTDAITALWDLEIEPTPNPVQTHTVGIQQG